MPVEMNSLAGFATPSSYVRCDGCVSVGVTPQARWASSPTRRSSSFSLVLLYPHTRIIPYVSGLSCDCAAGMPHPPLY